MEKLTKYQISTLIAIIEFDRYLNRTIKKDDKEKWLLNFQNKFLDFYKYVDNVDDRTGIILFFNMTKNLDEENQMKNFFVRKKYLNEKISSKFVLDCFNFLFLFGFKNNLKSYQEIIKCFEEKKSIKKFDKLTNHLTVFKMINSNDVLEIFNAENEKDINVKIGQNLTNIVRVDLNETGLNSLSSDYKMVENVLFSYLEQLDGQNDIWCSVKDIAKECNYNTNPKMKKNYEEKIIQIIGVLTDTKISITSDDRIINDVKSVDKVPLLVAWLEQRELPNNDLVWGVRISKDQPILNYVEGFKKQRINKIPTRILNSTKQINCRNPELVFKLETELTNHIINWMYNPKYSNEILIKTLLNKCDINLGSKPARTIKRYTNFILQILDDKKVTDFTNIKNKIVINKNNKKVYFTNYSINKKGLIKLRCYDGKKRRGALDKL